MGRVLIIAEHDNQNLNSNSRCMVNAALQLSQDVDVLIAGESCSGVGDAAAKLSGVSKVLLAEDSALANHLAENLAKLVTKISDDYEYLISPATTFGKDFTPRIAAELDIQQLSEIIEIIDGETFKRPIYAGNAIATVKSNESKKILTVRPSNFDKVEETGSAEIEKIDAGGIDEGLSSFVRLDKTESDRPDLSSAERVVSGGRGMASGDNFKLLESLADKLGAAIGASRAAVDAGYVPNDYQVGQTGKIIAPELYIAVGISGAIQHMAGMKESKVIVAINKDENAPIFEAADIGIVGDLFEILPELESKL